jgi:hypothetical protein
MHKNATKCNKTQSKWCINKHGTLQIIDTFETYQAGKEHQPGTQERAAGWGWSRGRDARWHSRRRTSLPTDLAALKGLEQQDVRVNFIISHRLVTEHKSRCDGIEFFAESGDDVVDELVVGERRTSSCHDITEAFICCMY